LISPESVPTLGELAAKAANSGRRSANATA
jgi:hypothetical protein